MTVEHVIERVRQQNSLVNSLEQDEKIIILNALEKQIPRKPDLEGDGYVDGHLVYDTWICPNCDKEYEVDYEEYDWCPHCGQHIDWSE